MTEMVDLENHGDIAVLTIDNPPVNALSHGVRLGLQLGLAAIAQDDSVAGVVVVCAGRTFIAGADITEFGKPIEAPWILEVLDAMEASTKPIVAAIHGTALGGGLETALACHYRVAVAEAKFGLPEVKLGLIPGAGGTQRLPRIVGPERALDMIVSGVPMNADEALSAGLIERIVDGDLLKGAVAFAQEVVAEKRPLLKVRDRDDKVVPFRGNDELFSTFRSKRARRIRGFEAPEAGIKAVEAAVNLPFD
ncbi:MAG: enoyl-CoA hydratase/isomerase family protein, partial [Gammaproteobacteria bacterium]|nr:enoyl-CoA hydratase/isomerase family protein [Gammaproteobacteria bacterium]